MSVVLKEHAKQYVIQTQPVVLTKFVQTEFVLLVVEVILFVNNIKPVSTVNAKVNYFIFLSSILVSLTIFCVYYRSM